MKEIDRHTAGMAHEPSGEGPRLVRRRPHPGLRGLVAGLVGMQETARQPVHRRQPAGTLLPMVLSFGDPLEITEISDGEGGGRSYGSFLAGLQAGYAETRFVGTQRCVQVYLTPLGVQRVLALPGAEVARQVIDLGAVAPSLGGTFAEMLARCPGWEERFDLVEAALLDHVAGGRPGDPAVAWMWRQIVASGGRARIAGLIEETGWSHRHATTRFREQVGLTPKAAAGIIRFERTLPGLAREPLAALAARHGYADQSHLSREVMRYAGSTPRDMRRRPPPTAREALGLPAPRA